MSDWRRETSSRSRPAIRIRSLFAWDEIHGHRPLDPERRRPDGPSVRRHTRLQAAHRRTAGTARPSRYQGHAGRDHRHHRIPAGARSVRARVPRRRRRGARRASGLHRRDDLVLERAGPSGRRPAGRGRHRHRRPRPRRAPRARRRAARGVRLCRAELPESDRPADELARRRGTARLGGGPRRADHRGRSVRRAVLRRRGDGRRRRGRSRRTTAKAGSCI